MLSIGSKRLIICCGLILLSINTYPHQAWSDVGTPCTGVDECEPGEVCAPGRLPEDASFCTRRCGPDRPCPEAYVCEASGGLALCNTPVEYAELGEDCVPSCAEGLLCIDDGSEEYCSIGCTLPGSCPEGFSCRPGSLNACAKMNMQPSIGEPCNETDGCSADYECLALPNRTLPYCSYACAEITCPPFMVCDGEGEEARCIHEAHTRVLGDSCVNEAQDESTIGCVDTLTCERNRDQSICTRDCSREQPCPDGFGCVDRPEPEDPSIGRCLPDVDSSPGLEPPMNSQMPQAGMMMSEIEAGTPTNTPPNNNPPAGEPMDTSGGDTDGCNQQTDTKRLGIFSFLVIAGFLFLRTLLSLNIRSKVDEA